MERVMTTDLQQSAKLVAESFKSQDLMFGGKKLNILRSGSGAPIVLFHSLLADRTSFDPLALMLAKTNDVITLSLPGFEGSDFVGADLGALADQVVGAVGSLNLSQKPILLGNGFGGFVALVCALRHPNFASRLVLADCGACFSEPGRAAFRNMSNGAKEKGLEAVADIAMRRLFAPEFQVQNPELIADRKTRFLKLPLETFHGACLALSELDLRPQLAGMTLPTLVLVGDMDEATPPAMSHELAEMLPNAQLIVLNSCAHVPQLQSPDVFMANIKSFIQG
jgi:3-oxoadipate enol-lactonase